MNKLRAILRRRWPVLLATLVVGVLAGYLSANSLGPERKTTQYQADQVVVANRMSGNPASVPQDALKVSRGRVPKVAAEILGSGDPATLGRKVQAKSDEKSNSISLRVYDTDPKRASEIVQAFTQAFLQVVNEDLRSEDQRHLERLEKEVADAEAALTAFDEKNGFVSRGDIPLAQTPSIDALVAERTRLGQTIRDAKGNLEKFQLEISQREPYSTLGPERPRVADSQLLEVPESPLFRSGLLGLVGLLLGIGLVVIVERVNRRVDTREELAELLDMPIIAEIGRIHPRQIPSDEAGRIELEGAWSEHYRRVRSAIEFVQTQAAEALAEGRVAANGTPAPSRSAVTPPSDRRDPPVIAGHGSGSTVPRTFMFVSALPGEGKSTSVALTALAMAEAGDDVLALSADFRRPKLERYLGMQKEPSLADLAEMTVDRPSVNDVVQSGRIPHLWTASAGRPTIEVTSRLIAAREVAVEAAAQGVTVLLDSSPLRVSNDPVDLLSVADEVILVVRAGRSTVKSLQDTVELLQMHHAPLMGVVLIGTLATRELYAYYASYYRDMEEAEGQKRRWGRRRKGTDGDASGQGGASGDSVTDEVRGATTPEPVDVLAHQGSAGGMVAPPPHPLMSIAQDPPAVAQRNQSATAVDNPNENRR